MSELTTKAWNGIDNIHADAELVRPQDKPGQFSAAPSRNAVNFDFSAAGKPISRRGFTTVRAGVVSNGFAFGQFLLYCHAGFLRAFHIQTGADTQLFAVQGSALGRAVVNDLAYVSDGISKWKIDSALVVSDWEVPASDDSTYDGRVFVPFPACTKLAYFQGRMCGAIGNVVVYSAPYAFGVYDPATAFFTTPTKVNVLYGNGDALFMGADNVYVATDLGLSTTKLDIVLAIASADSHAAADNETGIGYWMTERGVVAVPLNGTEAMLLSPKKLAVRPAANAAIGLFKREGVTNIVASLVPDSSFTGEHPLVSRDYTASEATRKEIFNAL